MHRYAWSILAVVVMLAASLKTTRLGMESTDPNRFSGRSPASEHAAATMICLPEGFSGIPDRCEREIAKDWSCASHPPQKKLLAYSCAANSLTKACPGYHLEPTAFSFAKHLPAPQEINGVSLPRNDYVLYRGIPKDSPQWTLPKVLRSLLGDPTPEIGTLYHSGLLSALNSHGSYDSAILSRLKIKPDFDQLHDCRAQGYSYADSALLAADLMEKSFLRFEEAGQIPSGFFRYRDPLFTALNEYGTSMIYGALHPKVSEVYGSKVLIYRDPLKRGNDINYWNYVQQNLWAQHTLDTAEYLMPGYIRSEEVQGLYQTDRERDWSDVTSTRNIIWAYHRLEHEGKTFVMVVDTKRTPHCVMSGKDGLLYPCEDPFHFPGNVSAVIDIRGNRTSEAVYKKPFVADGAKPLPVIAVIEACMLGQICKKPDWMRVLSPEDTAEALPKDVIDEIKNIRFVNSLGEPKRAVIHDVRAREKVAGRVEVLNAYWTPVDQGHSAESDVTAYVANFCDAKASCEYKVSARFLPDLTSGQSKKLSVRYRCTGSSDTPKSAEIPAPSVDQKITLSCEPARATH